MRWCTRAQLKAARRTTRTRRCSTSSAPITVGANTSLSYWIYPQGYNATTAPSVSGTNSTCVAIDMVFTDGTALRNLGAVDENGNQLRPARQCGHLTLDPVEPGDRRHRDGSCRQTDRAHRRRLRPARRLRRLRGYIDDIPITDQGFRQRPTPQSIVNPLMGTGDSWRHRRPDRHIPRGRHAFRHGAVEPRHVPDRAAGGGYTYSDNQISGFSLTHLSGPGCARYGDVPFLPTVGGIGGSPGSTTQSFSHVQAEQASPASTRRGSGATS